MNAFVVAIVLVLPPLAVALAPWIAARISAAIEKKDRERRP
jgi:hypothetical protein